MEAVVSLLDEIHTRAVEELWAELRREFNVRMASERGPFPHITYQGADSYDSQRLDAALHHLAREMAPITIETAGLGIFTGPLPVLYISVVRSPTLADFHRRVWHALGDAGSNISSLYSSEHWMPHITLAQWDIPPEKLPHVLRLLAGRPFSWQVSLTSLASVESESDAPDTHYRVRSRIELAALY